MIYFLFIFRLKADLKKCDYLQTRTKLLRLQYMSVSSEYQQKRSLMKEEPHRRNILEDLNRKDCVQIKWFKSWKFFVVFYVLASLTIWIIIIANKHPYKYREKEQYIHVGTMLAKFSYNVGLPMSDRCRAGLQNVRRTDIDADVGPILKTISVRCRSDVKCLLG